MAGVDPARASEAQQWIETVLGAKLTGDFFDAIRDGVVLCQVANKIRPGICKKFKKSSVAYVARSNIQIYLDACQKLNIPDSDRFESRDLFDKQRLGAVVDNIYALSAASRREGFGGPFIGVKYHDKNERHFSQETLNKGKSAIPAWMQTKKVDTGASVDGYGIVKMQGLDKHHAGDTQYGSKAVKTGAAVDGYGIVKMQGLDKHHAGDTQYGSKAVQTGAKVDGYGIVKMQGLDKHHAGDTQYGSKAVDGGKGVDGYGIVKVAGAAKHHAAAGDLQYGSQAQDTSARHDGYGIVRVPEKN